MNQHQQLVTELVAKGALRTPQIIAAFRAINRRDFVRPDLGEQAYANIPLPIGQGQTISQPYTVAFMLELLQPIPGNNVLEIGSGSGWQTALLAHLVGETGHVTALEIIPELCEWGQQNMVRYTYIDRVVVEVHCQNGTAGYPPNAPYDRIIAAAAGETIPPAWSAQLKVDGGMVLPIGSSIVQLRKTGEQQWQRHDYPGFAFVPLVSFLPD